MDSARDARSGGVCAALPFPAPRSQQPGPAVGQRKADWQICRDPVIDPDGDPAGALPMGCFDRVRGL